MRIPQISVVIPCRNEENFIAKCLDSILANDYPEDKIEILVVDGISDDKTRDILEKYCVKYPFIRLLDNYKKVTPVAINIGIKTGRGEFFFILSSHSKLDKNFLRKNIETFSTYNVDCVGGVMTTLPVNESIQAQSIAFALSSPFGVANAYFRIGSKEARYVDTVPFGCYKKEVFTKIGLFDEDMVRNQDDEFNLRLIKNDGKIVLSPDIVSYYYARGTVFKLCKMWFDYGYFKPLVGQKVGAILTWRQLIPPFFVSILFLSGILSFFINPCLWLFVLISSLYIFSNLVFSLAIALSRCLRCIFVLPVAFATIHFSYAFGYLKGIWDFIIVKKHKKEIEDVSLTR